MLSNVTARVIAAIVVATILGSFAVVWQKLQELGRALAKVPDGAVVAFDLPAGCPKENGWYPFDEADGRVIIGAGGAYKYRVEGGDSDIVLVEENLPMHIHKYDDIYYSSDVGRPEGTVPIEVPMRRGLTVPNDDNNVGWAVPRETEPNSLSGDGPREFTNMQPYITLYLCRRGIKSSDRGAD